MPESILFHCGKVGYNGDPVFRFRCISPEKCHCKANKWNLCYDIW